MKTLTFRFLLGVAAWLCLVVWTAWGTCVGDEEVAGKWIFEPVAERPGWALNSSTDGDVGNLGLTGDSAFPTNVPAVNSDKRGTDPVGPVALAGGGCATGGKGVGFAKPPLPLALMPGATDGRSVFIGFDFDAPVDWDGNPHAECGGLFRCFRLETPWHGFERALAVGDVATGSVWTLEFSRDFQPLYHGIDRESARRLVEDLARELGEECGIPLSPGKIYGSQETAYMGQAGAFGAILGFWWYPWEASGKLTEEPRALGCQFVVERIPSRIPPPQDGTAIPGRQ